MDYNPNTTADHCDRVQARNIALWLANAELRYRRYGDIHAANRVHDEMVGVVSSRVDPNLFLAEIIRGLGKGRAKDIGIEPWVVERAYAV